MILDALVAEHIRVHGDDPQRSLAALHSIGPVRDDLSRATDPDIQASLAHVAVARRDDLDPDRTGTFAGAGEPTSAGTRFRILRPHARGGLGEIFVARDTELNRDVALKEIQQQFADDPQYRTRFEFEAEVTGGLEHPGIVPVYGLGHTPDGRPFYAMRLVKGDSLKEAVRLFRDAENQPGRDQGQSTLGLRELLGRFIDVCDAVAYAHSRSVLHRDLKPANILLGKYGETLVVDWGLAKALGAPEPDDPIERSEPPMKPASGSALQPTEIGSAIGTPGYMSPEQVDGRSGTIGVRSDVYCLGATLYHLLTGHAPCEAEERGQIYQKVLAGAIPRPRSINSRIAPALEAICLKALALNPAGRYSSAEALKADIERWLADEPVGAYPEPLAARAARWVRRNKPWVVAAAGLLFLSLLGLAAHDWRLGLEQAKTASQLGKTRDAITSLLDVASKKLAEVPNADPLRRELAQIAVEKFNDIVSEYPNDPGVQLELAHVFRVIADIERITGNFAASDESCIRAIDTLTALCRAQSDPFEYRRWLAEAVRERGELYDMHGQTKKAEEFFRSALEHSELLLIRPIASPYRRVKGSSLIDLAVNLVRQNRHVEARTAANQAVELLKPISLGKQKSAQRYRDAWFLCMALTSRGLASLEVGDDASAKRDFDDAETLANQVIAADDDYDEDLEFQLACIDNHRGRLLGKSPESLDLAVGSLTRAVPRLLKLAENNQRSPHYREELAVTFFRRATARLSQERFGNAQTDCRESVGLLERLIQEQAQKGVADNPQYLSLLGQATVLAGRIELAQGRGPESQNSRRKGIEFIRRAVQIDEGRAQDKVMLDEIEAETSRVTQ